MLEQHTHWNSKLQPHSPHSNN